MLLDRLRTATWPSRSPRLQDRVPSDAQVRGRARGRAAPRASTSWRSSSAWAACRSTVGTTTTRKTSTAIRSTGGASCSRSSSVLRAHLLRTAKAVDFELFAQCLEICRSGKHLERAGLIEIAEVAERMNHRKSRKELIGIPRGHTPDTSSADEGEEMVPSAWRHAGGAASCKEMHPT